MSRNRHQVQNRKQQKKDKKAKNTKFTPDYNQQVQCLKPMNNKQQQYIKLCNNQDIVIQTGFSGTQKTYIPTRIQIEKLLNDEIDKIVLVRPQISMSKSLGFFQGSVEEKMKQWLGQSLSIFHEVIGESHTEYLIKKGKIIGQPLETIKGMSFKNQFIIIDEAQDITQKEFQIISTRLGEGSTMIFQGDIRQCDLNIDSGLLIGIDMIKCNYRLPWGYVDFDSYDDIVRSDSVREAVIEFVKRGIF